VVYGTKVWSYHNDTHISNKVKVHTVGVTHDAKYAQYRSVSSQCGYRLSGALYLLTHLLQQLSAVLTR
jgi:hypothetical protein